MLNISYNCLTYVTGPAKINHVSPKKIADFSVFALSLLTNCLNKHNKISVTTAEFNKHSSEIYGNEIPHSELKIFAKI